MWFPVTLLWSGSHGPGVHQVGAFWACIFCTQGVLFGDEQTVNRSCWFLKPPQVFSSATYTNSPKQWINFVDPGMGQVEGKNTQLYGCHLYISFTQIATSSGTPSVLRPHRRFKSLWGTLTGAFQSKKELSRCIWKNMICLRSNKWWSSHPLATHSTPSPF